MALNTWKCNHLMPPHFKGLIQVVKRNHTKWNYYPKLAERNSTKPSHMFGGECDL